MSGVKGRQEALPTDLGLDVHAWRRDVRTGLSVSRACAVITKLPPKLLLLPLALMIAPFTTELCEINCARLVFGLTVRMSARLWLRHFALRGRRGIRYMLLEDYWCGSGDRSFCFTLFLPDGRRRAERFADACVIERGIFCVVLLWSGDAFLIV